MAGLQLEPWAFDTAPVTGAIPGTMSGGVERVGEGLQTVSEVLFMLVMLFYKKEFKTKEKKTQSPNNGSCGPSPF